MGPGIDVTEREMLNLLHARYSFVRPYTTARRYAVAEHVSNVGSTLGSGSLERIADFLAQDTYREFLGWDGRPARTQHYRNADGSYSYDDTNGSYRQVLHGHEVKVSRSDWLTELRDPTKADAWKRYCDKWWLVAPKDVVRGDLPEGWGWMVPSGKGLRVVVQAPLLTPEPMPTNVRVQVMRAVQKTSRKETLRELG